MLLTAFFDRGPSVFFDGFCRLFEQAFNVVPVVLNQVTQALLTLNFLRKALQGLFLLLLSSLQTFDFGGLPTPWTGLVEAFLFPALQRMSVVGALPRIDDFTK